MLILPFPQPRSCTLTALLSSMSMTPECSCTWATNRMQPAWGEGVGVQVYVCAWVHPVHTTPRTHPRNAATRFSWVALRSPSWKHDGCCFLTNNFETEHRCISRNPDTPRRMRIPFTQIFACNLDGFLEHFASFPSGQPALLFYNSH